MKKLFLLSSLLFAVALCANLQASDGDTKRNAAAQTDSIALSDGDQKKTVELTQLDILVEAFGLLDRKNKTKAQLEEQLIRLPDDASYLIGQFADSKKRVALNLDKFIPALMYWPSLLTDIEYANSVCSLGVPITSRCILKSEFSQTISYTPINAIAKLRATDPFSEILSNKNSFAAGRFKSQDGNKRPIFSKVPGCQLKRLLNLESCHLYFIAKLSDRKAMQTETAKQVIRSSIALTRFENPDKPLSAAIIKLTPPEKQQFDALAAKDANMAENLKKNYEIE